MDRSFGSFVASNVEKFLDNPVDVSELDVPTFDELILSYRHIKTEIENCENRGKQHKIKTLLFPQLRSDVVYLNHGAFGLTLGRSLALAHKYSDLAETDPLRFYDRYCIPSMCQMQVTMARYLRCSPRRFVFVENVTFGFASVIQSMTHHFRKNGMTPIRMACFSTTYGCYKRILLREDSINLTIIDIDAFVDSDDEVIRKFSSTVDETYDVALLDHITSQHGRVLPVEDLCTECDKRGVISIVDGAHALGSVWPGRCDTSSGPTPPGNFYLTNCHKWFCASKGVAMVFLPAGKSSTQDAPHSDHPANDSCEDVHTYNIHQLKNFELIPAVRSHGCGYGEQSEFSWTGLKDYGSLLSIGDTIAFWTVFETTNNSLMATNASLCHHAAIVLSEMWNSEILTPQKQLGICPMVCVALPARSCSNRVQNNGKIDYSYAEWFQNRLYEARPTSIQVPVKVYHSSADGESCLYVRLSAHIYNDMNDFRILGETVRHLCVEKTTIK